MVDTLALGASAVRREGSSPFIRTKVRTGICAGFCFGVKIFLNLHPKGGKAKTASGSLRAIFR